MSAPNRSVFRGAPSGQAILTSGCNTGAIRLIRSLATANRGKFFSVVCEETPLVGYFFETGFPPFRHILAALSVKFMDPQTPPTSTSGAFLPVAGFQQPAPLETAQQRPGEFPNPFAEPVAECRAQSHQTPISALGNDASSARAPREASSNPYAPPTSSITEAEGECFDRAVSERAERLFKLAHGFRFFCVCYAAFVLLVGIGFFGPYNFWGWAIFPFLGMWLASVGMASRSLRPLEAFVCICALFIPCICIFPMILCYQLARADLIRNGAPIQLFGPPRSYLNSLKPDRQRTLVRVQERLATLVYLACAFLAFVAGLLIFMPA